MTAIPAPTDAQIQAAIRAVDAIYLDEGDDRETSAHYRWSNAQIAVAESNLLSIEAGMHKDSLVYGEIDLELFGEALSVALSFLRADDDRGASLRIVDVGSGYGRVRFR
jgi:hypothetical protein